ncbi:hypothetical protein BDW74DRAFT_182733 [Aspergillus multicolor]|uniref:Zn(II)2Cys6 transcription factor n=1 Tax=Aspergillus multicolor TaxID=41759 RepID=UPI003CCE2950
MAAPSRSGSPPFAPKVCATCRTRKKRCDKALPCCGYCAEKGLQCQYQEPRLLGLDLVPRPSLSETSSTVEATVCREVQRIISFTGQYLDEISVRYFQSIHWYLPIISRQRFHAHLLSFGTDPRADFSVLVLSMCMLTYDPDPDRQDGKHVDSSTLYLATKSLFSQAQTIGRPSLNLIQAGILLAVYEYARGERDLGFVSMGVSARLAYAAGLKQPTSLPSMNNDVYPDEEDGSTWWGICMCERIALCDVNLINQPLLSIMPKEVNAFSCRESESVPSTPSNVYQDGFRQAMRATYLLDELLEVLKAPESSTKQRHLDDLDKSIQVFLTMTMQRFPMASGVYCGGISIAIRGLFLLHRQVLDRAKAPSGEIDCPKEAYLNSRAALDTVTKIVSDIATARQQLSPDRMDAYPPTYAYLIRTALKYIHEHCQPLSPGSWLWEAEKRLQHSRDLLRRRWE